MLTVDLKNAFNLGSRSAFLEAVRNLFAELLPRVWYRYPYEAAHLSIGRHMIKSTRGTQHGDNFGGLIFDLVLHPIVLKIQALLRSGHKEDEHLANLLLKL